MVKELLRLTKHSKPTRGFLGLHTTKNVLFLIILCFIMGRMVYRLGFLIVDEAGLVRFQVLPPMVLKPYGVMVAQQILVLPVEVRILHAQHNEQRTLTSTVGVFCCKQANEKV